MLDGKLRKDEVKDISIIQRPEENVFGAIEALFRQLERLHDHLNHLQVFHEFVGLMLKVFRVEMFGEEVRQSVIDYRK